MNGHVLIQKPPTTLVRMGVGVSFQKRPDALARTKKKLPPEAGGEIHGASATDTEMASP